MPLKLITPPSGLAVDETVTKQQHLRILHDLEDSVVQQYIKSATDEAERKTGRQLLEATYELILDGFNTDVKNRIYLPKPPLKSIESITYYDAANQQQTLATSKYYVEVNEIQGYVEFLEATPAVYDRKDAVKITFKAGYGESADLPESIKQWIMIRTANFFEFRQGAEKAEMSDALLWPFMLPELI